MVQESPHSSDADSVLSPMDKDSLSVPEGDASAKTQADPTSNKPSDETPVHNARAVNDIIESAPANDAIPYFIHINGIKGLGTIATSPELATPAPYEQTPVRIHNQFMKQGTISPCDVALIETGSALANARTTSTPLFPITFISHVTQTILSGISSCVSSCIKSLPKTSSGLGPWPRLISAKREHAKTKPSTN